MNLSKREYRATADWPYQIAAGGVVFRQRDDGQIEVTMLVRDHPEKNYNLPKGTLHVNESLENCARREALEESGCEGKIVGYLGALHDNFFHPTAKVQTDRTTHYFAMEFAGEVDSHDAEHDRVEWHELDEARELLYQTMRVKREYEILDRLKEFLNKKDSAS